MTFVLFTKLRLFHLSSIAYESKDLFIACQYFCVASILKLKTIVTFEQNPENTKKQ